MCNKNGDRTWEVLKILLKVAYEEYIHYESKGEVRENGKEEPSGTWL